MMEERLVGCRIAGEEEGVELALVIEGAEFGGRLKAHGESALVRRGDQVRPCRQQIRMRAGGEEEVMDVGKLGDCELLAAEPRVERLMAAADEHDDAENEVQEDQAREAHDNDLFLHSPSG
jgi:hypothetical protein